MKRSIAILMLGVAGLLAACSPSSQGSSDESLAPVQSQAPVVESQAPIESVPAVSMSPSDSSSPSTAP